MIYGKLLTVSCQLFTAVNGASDLRCKLRGKFVGGEDGADVGEAHQFGHVGHVDSGVEFFSEGGEHGRDGAGGQGAPEEVDAFQVLGVGDDDEVAGLDAELGEGVGGLENGRSKHASRHMNIRLVGLHINDGVLAVIGSGEGEGIKQGAELGAGLWGKQG